jgi:serine phosphatase RsbU (regulator of sigma subunit)
MASLFRRSGPVRGTAWATNLMLTILAVVTLAIFVRDLIRDRREKQRLATELEAARAIQQILIPESNPSVAKFVIRSVYRPFGEVGGDFFQILPLPNGGWSCAHGRQGWINPA